MTKRSWLWIITVVLLLISLPSIINRWQVESGNDTYELALPYHEIVNLTKEGTLTLDDTLTTLKDAGLNTISLVPLTLNEMRLSGDISIYSQAELEKTLRFTHAETDYKQDSKGFYMTVPENPVFLSLIKEHFDPVKLTINDEEIYFIAQTEDSKTTQTSLGYNQEEIDLVKSYDFNYILRLNNDKIVEINDFMATELLKLKDDPKFMNILFSGATVIGHPDKEVIQRYATNFCEADIGFYSIESAKQHGLLGFARATNYDVVRLFSLDLNRSTDALNLNRVIRAVKERNIRTIFLHVKNIEPEESLEHMTDFLTAVDEKMPRHFKSGVPTSLNTINMPLYSKIATLLAGILFTALAASIFKMKWLEYVGVIFMSLLAMSYFVFQKLLFLQGFALVLAIVTPIFAVLATLPQPTTKIRFITLKFLKALGITMIGIVIIVGLLNGNGFVSGFELFRGVKLLYSVPLIFVAIILIWDKRWNKNINLSKGKEAMALLNTPVKYWHLLLIAIVGGLSYYYITRTGNAGSVSGIEIYLRERLEDFLYVRPRTKEFLIGLPIYLVALYVMGINERWGKILLIPGTIGFLSIINTFTHLHIPLSISVLRTVYGAIFGYLVGLLLIYIFSLGYRYIPKLFKKR